MTGAEAIALLSKGDEAYWAGARLDAVSAWRGALTAAADCPEAACRAVEAMAHLRLVHREGNLAPLWHEGAWNRALEACTPDDPWCALAEADAALFLPAFAGGSAARAAALAAPLTSDPTVAGAAAARLRLAAARGGPPAPADWPLTGDDGMARGMKARGAAEPPDPGTWTLGLGITTAPYAGIGGYVRFVDPDTAARGHRLVLQAFGDSAGEAGAAVGFTARIPASPGVSLAYSYANLYRWEGAAVYGTPAHRGEATLTAGWVRGPLTLSGGADALLVDPLGGPGPDAVRAVGPQASVRLADKAKRVSFAVGGRLLVGVDAAELHPEVSADLRLSRPVGKGELAARAYGEGAPGEPAWYLLPSVGGTTLLRGLPAGRFRDEWLAALQLELRHPLVGPLEGAIFVDSALCDGPHASVGAGLRVVLPPERDNVTRLDVGWSPDGWGVLLGWGEAF